MKIFTLINVNLIDKIEVSAEYVETYDNYHLFWYKNENKEKVIVCKIPLKKFILIYPDENDKVVFLD